MNPLYKDAIYVNRATSSLVDAINGKEISEPLTEHRAWTSGEKLFAEARKNGCDFALIFSQYEKLEYWALASEIVILDEDGKRVTRYRFSHLQQIPGRSRLRNDLTVISTGSRLPNEYIRSYVLVKTPDFLQQEPS